jgi:hypothetical protein
VPFLHVHLLSARFLSLLGMVGYLVGVFQVVGGLGRVSRRCGSGRITSAGTCKMLSFINGGAYFTYKILIY